jgi:hypothetical protein
MHKMLYVCWLTVFCTCCCTCVCSEIFHSMPDAECQNIEIHNKCPTGNRILIETTQVRTHKTLLQM